MQNNKQQEASNDRNLSVLNDEEQVRQRPAVIFGTNDENGAFNGIYEIITNSIDEAREGYGKLIKISIEEDYQITVSDDGRGLPMHWNESLGMYNWEVALNRLYGSGKYDSSQYQESAGLNGLGLTAMQYASEYMKVWSTYGGKTYYIDFKKGKPASQLKEMRPVRTGTGTTIQFKPDVDVFPALRLREIPVEKFVITLARQAMLLAGLTIEFRHYKLEKPLVLCYNGGMAEFLQEHTDNGIMDPVQFEDSRVGSDADKPGSEPYKVGMRMAFLFTKTSEDDEERDSLIEYYHNGSNLFEGGITTSTFERTLRAVFTEYARETGKLSKTEVFEFKDIADMMLCIVATTCKGNRTEFKNQTKGAITNMFVGEALGDFVRSKFKYWFTTNKQLADRVVTQAVANMKARIEGAAVSRRIIRSLSTNLTIGNKPKNFLACTSKDPRVSEIYIVEGNSALTSVKLACNPRFQAFLAIRGKVINCIKERLAKVLNSQVIIDIYRVLGCGMEIKSDYIQGLPEFNLNKLRYNKVIICTDADVDGYHIRCLLLTMFYVLSPSLIRAGKVYIAETPLYEISHGKEVDFAYDDNEKDKILAGYAAKGIKKYKIGRLKGLGENDPEPMSKSTLNPETRRLIQVKFPDDNSDVSQYFNVLLGDEIETRRAWINEYFDRVEVV